MFQIALGLFHLKKQAKHFFERYKIAIALTYFIVLWGFLTASITLSLAGNGHVSLLSLFLLMTTYSFVTIILWELKRLIEDL